METKEIVSMSISSLAFILSLAASMKSSGQYAKKLQTHLGKLLRQPWKTQSYSIKAPKRIQCIFSLYPAY